MDRYLYDELANLPLRNRFSAAYAKLLARMVPRPDLVFLLDAVPEIARARKPEYSVTFHVPVTPFLLSSGPSLADITIVPPLALEDTKCAILTAFLRVLGRRKSDLAGAAPAS